MVLMWFSPHVLRLAAGGQWKVANEVADAPVGRTPGDQASLATGELGRTSREGGTSRAGQSESAGHHWT